MFILSTESLLGDSKGRHSKLKLGIGDSAFVILLGHRSVRWVELPQYQSMSRSERRLNYRWY